MGHHYIDGLALAIRARVPQDLRPDEPHQDRLFRIYAVLALAKGQSVTAADVHDAWSAWMAEIDPDHPALKPFDELGADDQQQDEPFLRAIREAIAARSAAVKEPQ